MQTPRRTKWLQLGSLRANSRMACQPTRSPGVVEYGYWLNWRRQHDVTAGPRNPFAPTEFRTFAQVLLAFRHDLARHGLTLIAVATQLPRREYMPLLCQVQRAKGTTEEIPPWEELYGL